MKLAIITVIISVVVVGFAMIKDASEFEAKCRAAGGVPVFQSKYGQNCAKEGYIDIK